MRMRLRGEFDIGEEHCLLIGIFLKHGVVYKIPQLITIKDML
jgi:hypothetical protein